MNSAFQSGFASAVLEVIFDKLVTIFWEQWSSISHVDEELRKLQRTLQKTRVVVDHVENDPANLFYSSKNDVWKMWLVDLAKLSYSAEDIIDEISLQLLAANVDDLDVKQVRNSLLSSLDLKKANEIRATREQMEKIVDEMDSLLTTKSCKLGSLKIPSASLVNEGFVVGRNEEKEEIVKMLLNEKSSSVIPLVGMGGIGKTTIAKLVYNDNRVADGFDLRIWISVSVNFDLISISRSILESATGKRSGLLELDPIQSELKKFLQSNRFLLVLDDFWTEKYEDWDTLSSPFRAGDSGSKIIVTTRSTIVSSIVGTVPEYKVQLLSPENCWEVMKQRAFSDGNLGSNLNLERKGKEIAKKCKGLPLAAKCLGGLLRFKPKESDWESILQCDISNLPQEKDCVSSALLLSYHFLPAHLKRCFAYCSTFPRNHKFKMDELVLLWMAEGFIQPRGETGLEDIGCDYFKELMWRSFFQVLPDGSGRESEGDDSNPPEYQMHELIRGMAELVSARTCFCLEDEESQLHHAPVNARHLYLSHKGLPSLASKPKSRLQNLRTLIMMSGNGALNDRPILDTLFLKLKYLRVLCLSNSGLKELPDSICYLKHLRYLNLSDNPIETLPEPITKLFRLQTIKLNNCLKLSGLPSGSSLLINLRHLHYNKMRQLMNMPPGLGNLTNLQTLLAFNVGSKEQRCGIGELGKMKFLRGSICIAKIENVLNGEEAKAAKLCEKPFLDNLELEWSSYMPRIQNPQEVLESLRPHENLKKITIINYSGTSFPDWLSSPTCYLTSIWLQSCRFCSILPSLGALPLLQSLHVDKMDKLEKIDGEFFDSAAGNSFRSLESLTFERMASLIEWTGLNCHDLPRLTKLKITSCRMLSCLPSLHNLISLHKLEIIDCPQIQELPAAGLGSVQHLIIEESAILTERCKEGAEDWNKVTGIPRREIQYE